MNFLFQIILNNLFVNLSSNASRLLFWRIHLSPSKSRLLNRVVRICDTGQFERVEHQHCPNRETLFFLGRKNVFEAITVFRTGGQRSVVAVYASSGQLSPNEELFCNKPPLDFQVYYERVWALSWSWRRRWATFCHKREKIRAAKGVERSLCWKMCTIQIQNGLVKV